MTSAAESHSLFILIPYSYFTLCIRLSTYLSFPRLLATGRVASTLFNLFISPLTPTFKLVVFSTVFLSCQSIVLGFCLVSTPFFMGPMGVAWTVCMSVLLSSCNQNTWISDSVSSLCHYILILFFTECT